MDGYKKLFKEITGSDFDQRVVRKKNKAAKNKLIYVPKSYNFSEMETEEGEQFDVSDNFYHNNALYDELDFEILFLDILSNLSDREKIVFLFCIVREYGHNIDHKSFAKTMGIVKESYMVIKRRVQQKTAIIVNKHRNTTLNK
jgi:hypothetical protein